MRSITDDITVDGWLALCIAVIRGVPQQTAFRMLEEPLEVRRWIEEDYLEIEDLRKSGASWKTIGEMFDSSASNVFRQYHRWKDKQKKKG